MKLSIYVFQIYFYMSVLLIALSTKNVKMYIVVGIKYVS